MGALQAWALGEGFAATREHIRSIQMCKLAKNTIFTAKIRSKVRIVHILYQHTNSEIHI